MFRIIVATFLMLSLMASGVFAADVKAPIVPDSKNSPISSGGGLLGHRLAYEQNKVVYSHEDAIELARKEKSYVFVYFHAEWCDPCNRIEQTFNNPGIKPLLKRYVIFVVDVDREPSVLELYKRSFARHPFSIRGIPAYFLVNPYNRKIVRWGDGYKSPNQFKYWLETNK